MPTTVVVKPLAANMCIAGRRGGPGTDCQCIRFMLTLPVPGDLIMNETLKSLDFRHLERRLQELEVEIGCLEDGKFIACSYSEPLFCLERNSEEEAKTAVIDTLQSYIRAFYKGLDKFEIGLRESQPIIPQQFVKPISKLRPAFEARDGERYAIA
jgi:hypothetical protein